MRHSPEPDAFEKRLRFGCGFAFGGLLGFVVGITELAALTGTFWAAVAGAAVVFGFLAMRYGDAFWESVSGWLHWW